MYFALSLIFHEIGALLCLLSLALSFRLKKFQYVLFFSFVVVVGLYTGFVSLLTSQAISKFQLYSKASFNLNSLINIAFMLTLFFLCWSDVKIRKMKMFAIVLIGVIITLCLLLLVSEKIASRMSSVLSLLMIFGVDVVRQTVVNLFMVGEKLQSR